MSEPRTGRILLAAGLWVVIALALGCSHGPRPRAVAADPAAVADDSLAGKREPKSGSAARPRTTTRGSATADPAAPAAPTARSGGSSSAPAAPAPAAPDTTALLEPALAPEERAKLEEKTRTTIDAARTRLESVDAARLDAERLRKYRLANDYLTEAMRARDARDLQRASTLALKAKLLAEEL